MDDLKTLQSLGLMLPSPAYLVGSLLFGIVGLLAFRRGGRLQRPALRWPGLALMLYPYAVDETWMLWGIGVLLTAWVVAQWK